MSLKTNSIPVPRCEFTLDNPRTRCCLLGLGMFLFATGLVVVPGDFVGSAFLNTALAQTTETPIADAAEVRSLMNDADAPPAETAEQPSGIDLLSLIFRGGVFMVPIAVMSMLVVTLAVERFLTLRWSKVVPRRLERELRSVAHPISQLDPEEIWDICRGRRDAASRVILTMLRRTGQPVGEIERAATEATQLEADRCARPIRWLTLAAAATPLMGLLGTVWGMIVAFHESTTLTADRSRSEQLSEGIYTALVTTLAGLVVAIPAAILAQYLENRVSKLFGRIEQLAMDLAPGFAKFVGNSRLIEEGSVQPFEKTSGRSGMDVSSSSARKEAGRPPKAKKAGSSRDGLRTRS